MCGLGGGSYSCVGIFKTSNIGLILSPLNIPSKCTYVILQAEGKRIYSVYNTLSRQMSLK